MVRAVKVVEDEVVIPVAASAEATGMMMSSGERSQTTRGQYLISSSLCFQKVYGQKLFLFISAQNLEEKPHESVVQIYF